MGFIDTMRGEGFAVETVCAVLRQQGVQVAARTYRRWRTPDRQVAARTVTESLVLDTLRDLRTDAQDNPAPESLDGRRKMTALLRRNGITFAHCTVDRLMPQAGMNGVRRGRVPRTTIAAKDGVRAGDLLNRDFSRPVIRRRGLWRALDDVEIATLERVDWFNHPASSQ